MNTRDLEQELTESLAEEMRKTIDFEVMAEIMVENGYTRIEVEYGFKRMWFEVVEWANKTCIGEYQEHNGVWLFENEKDAIMFKLKWL